MRNRDKYKEHELGTIALKYTTRAEMRKGNESALKAIRRNGWEYLLSHMGKAKTAKVTYEEMCTEALKYEFRTEFQRYSNREYQAAVRDGILQDVCSHMDYKQTSWDKRTIAIEAGKFSSRRAFELGNPKAYNAAIRNRLLDELFHGAGYINTHWTKDMIMVEAAKYLTPIDFKTRSPKAYHAARTANLLQDVTAHMTRTRSVIFDDMQYKPGVYLLYCKGSLVYIGKSIDMRNRVLTHTKEGLKEFDKIVGLCIPLLSDMDVVEVYLITSNLPKYNKDNNNIKPTTLALDYSACVSERFEYVSNSDGVFVSVS